MLLAILLLALVAYASARAGRRLARRSHFPEPGKAPLPSAPVAVDRDRARFARYPGRHR